MVRAGQLRQWKEDCPDGSAGEIILVTGMRSSAKAAPSTRSWFVLQKGVTRWFYESEMLVLTRAVR
jgi:hypothetical protein